MALELQQSGRGTTEWWLSGARRDADIEQGEGDSLNPSLMNILFLFSPLNYCDSLICQPFVFYN